jgi:hypothetical protein
MANGSFGLSGFPTAPTTTSGAGGGGDTNPFTPISVAVNSTAGFEAGDLVYNFGGDIQPVPNNYVSSATFPLNADLPVNVQNVALGELQSPPVTMGYTARSGSGTAAKLSNGNIVIVYSRTNPTNNQSPYFKIINEAGTEIVTDTLIEVTTGQAGCITVGALTGGGFAVAYFTQSTNYVRYAIYTNTGAVTLAPTQDTTPGISDGSSWINVVGRPDGSWILGINGSSSIKHRIFSATGVAVYSWTTVTSIAGVANQFKYVARSDNSFVVFNGNASNQISYTVYSATNTVVVANTNWSSTSPGAVTCWGNATVFSNDTILVTHGNGSNAFYTTLTSANVKSATTAYTNPTLSSNIFWASAYVLSSGNYILIYIASNENTNVVNGYSVGYSFYNSSHTLLSSAYFNGVTSFPLGLFFQPVVVETATVVNIIGSPAGYNYNMSNGAWSSGPSQFCWAKISPTTYNVVNASSTNVTIGTSGALPVSGYSRSASTPTAARFVAAASSTQLLAQTQASLTVGQTTIDSSFPLAAMNSATLSDGSALVLYKLSDGSTNAPLKLAVISSAGVLVSTTTLIESASLYIGNDTSTALMGFYKIIVLSDGKIAISYINSSSVPTVSILSSTYSILATTTIPTGVTGPEVTNNGISMAAMTNGRFVVVYTAQSPTQPYFRIYDSSLNTLVGASQINTNSSTGQPSVAATRNGFTVSWFNGSSNNYSTKAYLETATNTFAESSVATSGTSSFVFGTQAYTAPCGHTHFGYLAGSTSFAVRRVLVGSNVIEATPNNNAGGTLNSTYAAAFAVDAYGGISSFVWGSSSTVRMLYVGSGFNNLSSTQQTITLSMTSAVSDSRINVGVLAGRNVLLLVKNSSNNLSYCVVAPVTVSTSASITAGVSASSPVAISPSAGFSLVGVSSTAAPANGSGTVVINGPAQLSSSYPSTTPGQSFDFGNPVTFGAAGTISGRNVNLIGNV